MFEIEKAVQGGAKIKVVGVGGSGCNAVNTMIRSGLSGVEFITANTDRQALEASLATVKLAMGQELTKGLGAGANPEVGRKAALEDYAKISEILAGADMVFITAGMGGGTGTGAAPVFAKIAKEIGALTVGVVTKPFMFEGKKRAKHAEQGLANLRENVDSLIMIPNQRLLALAGNTLSMIDAFRKADDVLLNAVQGISDLINTHGMVNCDFADVRTIMKSQGLALMGIGFGEGEHRAIEAATNAISSPLLEDISIEGATGIIMNITGSPDMTIHEVNEATTLISESAHEDAEIIFGTVIDESLQGKMKITVIATGVGAEFHRSHGVQVPANAPIAAQQPMAQQPVAAPMMAAPSVMAQAPVAAASEAPVVSPVLTTPPAPTPQMLAEAKRLLQSDDSEMESFVEPSAPGLSSAPAGAASAKFESSELARARAIAQRLGISNLTDDEYDVPAYMRRGADRDM